MLQQGDHRNPLDRYWPLVIALAWLVAAAVLLHQQWNPIGWFTLRDTDDNMRMMQIRGLLAGQDWFDLRQYRLNPPFGADIHWSRLVDLPIAGIKLAMTPLFGGRAAEKIAIALAPMLPMAVAMTSLAIIARRLIGPFAFIAAIALLFCAESARLMWAPLRLDHHGWQLAALSLVMAALADRQRARGGILLGLATALSLVIGLEMLIYLAAAGAIVVLIWIHDATEAKRLIAYGGSLSAGTGFGYLLFASYANRAPVCDALSPVWLSAMLVAGALCVLLALAPLSRWGTRLGAALFGGLVLAGLFAWSWPHCLGQLEGISAEAQNLWLDHVREARPIYRQNIPTIAALAALPLAGIVGYAILIWRHRQDPVMLRPWLALGTLALVSAALLFWQTRAGPAAQLLAIPGAAGVGWLALGWIHRSKFMLVRVFGTVAAFLLVSGIAAQLVAGLFKDPSRSTPRMKLVNKADRACPTLTALRPIALLPKGYVLTHVDFGPRLITVTHHDAVTGPYHRNDREIVDVMKAFREGPEYARRMIADRGIDYVLICPNFSESTIYQADAPRGFYAQLTKGKVPEWLRPVPLPANSPFRMWAVVKR